MPDFTSCDVLKEQKNLNQRFIPPRFPVRYLSSFDDSFLSFVNSCASRFESLTAVKTRFRKSPSPEGEGRVVGARSLGRTRPSGGLVCLPWKANLVATTSGAATSAARDGLRGDTP